MKTANFFNTHPVFSLNEAAKILAPAGGRKGTVERLKYHLKTGRLKLVSRGVYAVVPPDVPAERRIAFRNQQMLSPDENFT